MERAEAEAIYDAGREACVELLVELSARYERQIARLEARVERLEARLREDSRNSSRPPSQDPPGAGPGRGRSPTGRAPGGQPGHEGTTRELVAEERVDRLIEHWPERCSGCGHRFGEDERRSTAPPHRHQVWELPALAVEIDEHRAHRVRCPRCSADRRAVLPGEVAASAFGPRLRAAVAMLSVRNRVSRRDACELLEELFGCPISPGSVDAICQRTSEALAAPYGELREAVKDARVVCVDETGWRQAGERRTLWGALTDHHAAFHIAADRHERELPELIGERFAGIVSSDRWWAYDRLDPARRQVCWAHLLRVFRRHSDRLSHLLLFRQPGLSTRLRLSAPCRRAAHHHERERLAREIAP